MSDKDIPVGIIEQLSRCTEWVEFSSQEQLATAVGHLLGCHRHNFIVLPNHLWTLCCSPMALGCLERAFPTANLEAR